VKSRILGLVLLAVCASHSGAQEITLTAEPVAAGVQVVTHGLPWKAGVSVTAGPLVGIALSDTDVSDAKNAANVFATVIYRPSNVQFVLDPIGAALVVGNDFSAVYPAAQAGADVLLGRWTLGTGIRTIRVAGPNGGADYWTHWIPIRAGLILGSP